MSHPQLKLRHSTPQDARKRVSIPNSNAAVERVFEHWVFMLGKNPKRCALGPDRRKVISKALALYDEDTVLLAIEGCAASAWHRGENDRGGEYTDLTLILRDEAHIERFADEGEALRARLEQEQAKPAPAASDAAAVWVDPAVVLEQKRKLRDLVGSLIGRRA
jgi:hypothetical protein